jgi:hypothetical protein
VQCPSRQKPPPHEQAAVQFALEVREQAVQQANELDLIRVGWLVSTQWVDTTTEWVGVVTQWTLCTPTRGFPKHLTLNSQTV